ncbi:MAG: rhomboid family intramembrane serine protease [Oscillospiraceae bacterium]|nr:rhomboid family intramembrane serine protease [Oscillospiraceae bacterium]
MDKLKKWGTRNTAAIVLAALLILIYIGSHRAENTFLYFGVTGIQYLNGEYYRFITCLFLHHNLRHLLANVGALLSVSSLLTPLLGKRQIIFLFMSGGILSEIAYSVVISEQIYDIGASSGIFALIAGLLVCHLKFQTQMRPVWYRPDVIIVAAYFLLANTSISAFLVHTFGFAAGVLIGSAMVSTGRIQSLNRRE